MPSITDISKMQYKTGDFRPRHEFYIRGEPAHERLRSVNIDYAPNGGSGAQLEVSGSLRDLDNAEVQVHLGYGDQLIPYFVGKLQRPRDHSRSNTSASNAYGPYKLMADQKLLSDETFRGMNLKAVLLELTRRAGYQNGAVTIIGGENFQVPRDEQFVYQNTLSDVAGTLLEKAGFVGMDQPGGRRVFMKQPKLGATTSPRTTYTEADYPLDGFQADPNSEVSYYSVAVIRRNAQGKLLSTSERKVWAGLGIPPPRRRVYTVDDFVGTIDEANAHSEEIAQFMRSGEWKFTLNLAMNPEILLYDTLRVIHTKTFPRPGGVQERRVREFLCIVNGGITLDYRPPYRSEPGTGTMQVSGDALLVSDVKVPDVPRSIGTGRDTGSVVMGGIPG